MQFLTHSGQLGRADRLRLPPALTKAEVARVGAILQNRLSEAPGIKDLAAEIGYPPFHFGRAFEAATGESPHRFAQRRQLGRVREMLEGATPITEIATACGFASRAQLVEVFRQDMGITPAAYRIGLLT